MGHVNGTICAIGNSRAYACLIITHRMELVRIVLLGLLATIASANADSSSADYCTYFGNREPGREPRLMRCQSYRENSCCQPDEEDISFNVDPIFNGQEGSDCQNTVNYLRCWICHPGQNMFYRNETLTVCQGMCNRLLADCGGARWRDGRVRDYYRNGLEFCQEMGFNVATSDCFTASSAARRTATFTSKLSTLVTLFAGFLLTGLLTKSSQLNAIMICMVVTVILLATPSSAQTQLRAQEVDDWSDSISLFINNLANEYLLLDEAQALFDAVEYNEVPVNGSEIVEHIRERLSSFAEDKLRALDKMATTVAREYNQFVREQRELTFSNPEELPLSVYRDSDASDHLPYDQLTFDRLVLV